MRYEKKVIVLSSVLAVLLLIWAAGLVFSPERMAARSESAHLLAGKAGDVASISLKASGGASIELAKSGSAWSLVDGSARLPVQAQRVASFIDELASVSRLRVVARSKDSWAGFQLDDAQAKRASLKDASGKVMADIYVGGYGPTGSEIYLRRADSDLSYSAGSGLAPYLGYGRSTWLDLRVMSGLKEDEVQSFAIKSAIALDGKGKAALSLDYALRRDGKGWKAGAAQIDADAAASLLRSIVTLQGEDYVATPPADAFARVDARIALELGSGKSKVLEVGATAGDNRFYARIAGESLVFTVSSFSLRGALKSLADLAPKK
ncbi:MAG: DUF4340 domain-containing protein [Rectinemataceae bacterium]|jgi:hypothetical protein